MTNEQAKRLDAAIAKAGLNWWEVQRKVGFDVFNDVVAIEVTIAAIEKMAKTEEPTEEVEKAEEKAVAIERTVLTVEDVEKAVATYTNEELILVKETENGKLVKIIDGDTVTTYAVEKIKTGKIQRNTKGELHHRSIEGYIDLLLRHGYVPPRKDGHIQKAQEKMSKFGDYADSIFTPRGI